LGQVYLSDIIDPKENRFPNSFSHDKEAHSVLTGHVMKIWIGRDPYVALARVQRVQKWLGLKRWALSRTITTDSMSNRTIFNRIEST
jgi:hypothetical protein